MSCRRIHWGFFASEINIHVIAQSFCIAIIFKCWIVTITYLTLIVHNCREERLGNKHLDVLIIHFHWNMIILGFSFFFYSIAILFWLLNWKKNPFKKFSIFFLKEIYLAIPEIPMSIYIQNNLTNHSLENIKPVTWVSRSTQDQGSVFQNHCNNCKFHFKINMVHICDKIK